MVVEGRERKRGKQRDEQGADKADGWLRGALADVNRPIWMLEE